MTTPTVVAANAAPTADAPVRAPEAWRFEPRRLVGSGAVCGLVMVFIALIGMPVELDPFPLIEPILSRGYATLVWVPLVFGYTSARLVVLEGVEPRRRGIGDLVDGAVVGSIGGLCLGVLAVLIDNFDLRDPLVNWSPQLFELLSFGNGAGFALVIWLVIGLGLGVIGAGLHLLPHLARSVVAAMVLAIVGTSVLETALTDLLQGMRIEFVADTIYAPRGGLSISGAILVAVVAAVVVIVIANRHRIRSIGDRAAGSDASGPHPVLTMATPTTGIQHPALILVGLAAVAVLPLLMGRIVNDLLANVGLYVLLALGLNIVVGLAGILDLGYVAFFAVGGYTTAVLTSPNAPWWTPEFPWLAALPFVVMAAAFVGLMIGAPVIRMRGDYLAIVTLGFGEIIRLLFLSDWLSPYFGGAQGITNIPGVDVFGLFTISGTDPRAVFYLVAVFCILAIYISWRLENSRIGRSWMAIREDESVAEAMGINTVNAKLLAFVVGAILASFSGAIFAAKVGSIFPSSFEILVSVVILVIVIVGGMGRIAGVILGAVVLIGVLGGPNQQGLLQEAARYKLLIYGTLLVWMMLKRPEGLLPNVRRSRELHLEEMGQDAWLRAEADAQDAEDSEDAEPASDGTGAT